MTDFCNSVNIDLGRSRTNLFHHNLFLIGDLNCTPPGSQLFKYGQPDSSSELSPSAQRGPLSRVLEQLTEIESAVPTRYNSEADTGSTLDRILTTIPPHIFKLCKVSHTVEQDPKQLFKSGLSDHAPTAASFVFRPTLSVGQGPIAPEIFRHWSYSHFLLKLVWDEKFNEIEFATEFEELAFLKAMMKAAQKMANEKSTITTWNSEGFGTKKDFKQ